MSFSIIVLAQIGVSLWNQYWNKEISDRIKEEQRQAKLEDLKLSQIRDMSKFQRSCELQEQLELENHKAKISSIQKDFLHAFSNMMHKDNLEKCYRLNISPYIVKKSIIPDSIDELDNLREDLFCILTGSNNSEFNRDVLPYLDRAICETISQYWNSMSKHQICYYKDIWDLGKGEVSNEDIENVKSLVPTPTVSITPYLVNTETNRTLIFKLNVWGIGKTEKISMDIETGIVLNKHYNRFGAEDIRRIVKTIYPYAVCAIGQIADIYYWINFHQPPHLPYLVSKKLIELPKDLETKQIKIYSDIFNRIVLGSLPDTEFSNDEIQVSKDRIEMNLYNHPERYVRFLENVLPISGDKSIPSEMIRNSMISFYSIKTDQTVSDLSTIDSSLIKNEDVIYLSGYINLAQKYGDQELEEGLIDLLKKKIMSWD